MIDEDKIWKCQDVPDSIGRLLGQSVSIDGCHVGMLWSFNVVHEQTCLGMPLTKLEMVVRMDEDTKGKLAEYLYCSDVMSGREGSENV